MKPEFMLDVLENAHAVAINMNDTFYYSCADVACIGVDELEDLEPIWDKYGSEAFIAYEAIRRGHDPVPARASDGFKEAKAMILAKMEHAEKEDYYGAFYELRQIQEQKPLAPKERKRVSRYLAKCKNWFSFFTHR